MDSQVEEEMNKFNMLWIQESYQPGLTLDVVDSLNKNTDFIYIFQKILLYPLPLIVILLIRTIMNSH